MTCSRDGSLPSAPCAQTPPPPFSLQIPRGSEPVRDQGRGWTSAWGREGRELSQGRSHGHGQRAARGVCVCRGGGGALGHMHGGVGCNALHPPRPTDPIPLTPCHSLAGNPQTGDSPQPFCAYPTGTHRRPTGSLPQGYNPTSDSNNSSSLAPNRPYGTAPSRPQGTDTDTPRGSGDGVTSGLGCTALSRCGWAACWARVRCRTSATAYGS